MADSTTSSTSYLVAAGAAFAAYYFAPQLGLQGQMAQMGAAAVAGYGAYTLYNQQAAT